MFDILKRLVKYGALALFLTNTVAFWPAVIGGFVVYKAIGFIGDIVDRIRASRSSAVVDKDLQAANIKRHRQNANKRYFKDGKWNTEALPFDMKVSKTYGGEQYFTVAGIENIVRGRRVGGALSELFGGGAEFVFDTESAEKAQKIADFIRDRGIVGVKVERRPADYKNHCNEYFVIIADNAEDISTIAKEFYPPRKVTVQREITTTQQYVVPGCATYEEARAKFLADRSCASLINTASCMQDTVDDKVQPAVRSSVVITPSMLAAGEFLINETSSKVYSRKITFNGGIDSTDDALESIASQAYTDLGIDEEQDLVERLCKEPVIEDGLGEAKVDRNMSVDGRDVSLLNPEVFDAFTLGAKVYIVFKSQEEIVDVLNGDKSLGGVSVVVDDHAPMIEGCYVMEVPLDNSVLSSLSSSQELAEHLYDKYSSIGVTREECDFSAIVHDLKSQGHYSNCRLTGDIDLSSAKVNGASLDEFCDRIVNQDNARYTEFVSETQQQQWLNDAAMIKTVDVHLDAKHAELVINTSVSEENGSVTMKSETRKLTDDEVYGLSRRGDFSKAEMKDLVMMMHPDFFKTYSVNNQPLYHDPLSAFIRNERPETVTQHNNKVQAQLRREQKKAERKAAVNQNKLG